MASPVLTDLLSHYFGSKLQQFSQATQKPTNSTDSDEDAASAEAMDMSSTPQPVEAVMGQHWAHNLTRIVGFLQQLGLQVC